MKKKNVIDKNYLDKKPRRKDGLEWSVGDDEMVTLQIENKGVFNRIFQVLLKKPKISYIHLDKMGSFVWPLLDGEKTITELGIPVKEHFGDEAEPLYERLAKYFQILESYKFITLE
ncbi:MAG: PqqD family protein [Clostridia bacterium]|nr:PqqD family protein [Clostridia bacterium]